MGFWKHHEKKLASAMFFAIFMAIGFVIIGTGWTIISQGNMKYDESKKDSQLYPTPINDSRPLNVISKVITQVRVDYQTEDTFSVNNPIDDIIKVSISNPNLVDNVVAVSEIVSPFLPEDNNDLANVVNSLNLTRDKYIQLSNNLNENVWVGEDKFNPHFEGSFVYVIAAYHNGLPVSASWSSEPRVIYPITEKLSADTDRIVKRQSYEVEQTNANVEGLTRILIGLIPIGFAIEIFIHKILP